MGLCAKREMLLEILICLNLNEPFQSLRSFDYIKGTLAAVGTYRCRGVFENERILCSTFTSLSVPEMRH